MRRLHRELGIPSSLDRFWDDDFWKNNTESEAPALNVKENDKEFKLEISIPGYEKKDIKVNVDRNILTISANKEVKNEEKDENEKILRQDFRVSSFYRSFTMPENVDSEKIQAEEKNGILCLTLPKMEKALENTQKSIEIK